MNLPKKVRILNFDFDLVLLKDKSDVNLAKSRIIYGEIDFENSTIRLWDNPNRQHLANVFIHECLHGIIDSIDAVGDVTQEEPFINRLAMALQCFIRDNDLAWLKDETAP